MKIYCQNCGKPTEYSAMNKPNFCFNCGSAFGGGVSNATQVQQEAQIHPSVSLEDADEVDSVPNVSKLQYDLDVEQVSAIKMQNLMGTAQDGVAEPPRGDSGLSDEELVRSVLSEGKSLKAGKQSPDNDG